MLVKYWMSKDVITVQVDDSMQKAMDLMDKNDIHMLPVMDNTDLVGIVTDRDLKRAKAAIGTSMNTYDFQKLQSEIKVESFMSSDLITVQRDVSIEETAEKLIMNKISGVPVVGDDGILEGVITKTDLFKVLISLTGLKKRGIQFALIVKDMPGSIREITEIIRKYGGRMACILTSYERVPKGFRRIYIRMYSIDRFKLRRLEEELREKAKLLYMVDHKEVVREIY
jgi:acetoin utilization protein AcuB